MNQKEEQRIFGVYLGNRDEEFRTLIANVLTNAKIDKKYIDLLTTDDSLAIYSSAFTSELIDENNNYQVYEQVGDLSANKFIVTYIYQRFPQLKCAEGVKVAARLRINYGSKQSFCQIAEELGFWPFISAPKDLRYRNKKSLLEDVFEAFIGATETIVDDKTKFGVGYVVVFRLLKSIFRKIKISLKYEDLYDAKTRLKELFDLHGETLGSLIYEELIPEVYNSQELVVSRAYRVKDGRRNLIGTGKASVKIDAQQNAATLALESLRKEGYVKKVPKMYAKLLKDSPQDTEEKDVTTEKDVLKVCLSPERINEQFFTRGKSKYQNKYTSTVLGMYCRKRDYVGIKLCVSMGADPNEKDIEGLTCTDLLLIGAIDEKIVRKVIKKFSAVKEVIISKDVYDVYKERYILDNVKVVAN